MLLLLDNVTSGKTDTLPELLFLQYVVVFQCQIHECSRTDEDCNCQASG